MNRETAREICDRLDAIRDSANTREDTDCRNEVIALCEVIGNLVGELRNIDIATKRAANTASCLANGIQPD